MIDPWKREAALLNDEVFVSVPKEKDRVMRTNRFATSLAVACLFVAASAVALAQEAAPQTSAPAAAPRQLYTCPMHPQIRWSRADACPLCGMKLMATNIGRPADEVDGGHSRMVLHVHEDMNTPAHAGMSMDYGPIGHDMMGCEMCMQMMNMGSMSHGPAPATQKAAPTAQRGYGKGGRGGRGCGC